jgi:hypothetical protein
VGILVFLIQDTEQWRVLQNAVINILIPLNVGKILTVWKTVSFSIRNLFHGLINFVTSLEKNLKPVFLKSKYFLIK